MPSPPYPTLTFTKRLAATIIGTLAARGLTEGAKAGIGVGVAMGVLCVFLVGMFCFFWMFRRREDENAELPQHVVGPKERPDLFSE